ncbi:class I SAM-dependent methyltransferase [Microbulbifer sp. GL-2]|uniref:class I SAM-dependent methyltransferase n=1 Tax=Microbulbifer sp. GL-2 TaxID=2591606 RepID=UPI00155A38D8|nr:class I SAM-dependent methyltransferase [Microbulbifer sp. GL-2]
MNIEYYKTIASYYDIICKDLDFDLDFYKSEKVYGKNVLELTSGTGRVSIPLLEAGAKLTCIDISPEMLKILKEKITQHKYSAEVICEDVTKISLYQKFELAILPFHSFMELLGENKQLCTLSRIYRALVPGGRFLCPIHNPTVRKDSVNGCLHSIGVYSLEDGLLHVSGFEQGGHPTVDRFRFYEKFDKSGKLNSKHIVKMKFELISKDSFEEMANRVGFKIKNIYGDYERNSYSDSQSPFIIWDLVKS